MQPTNSNLEGKRRKSKPVNVCFDLYFTAVLYSIPHDSAVLCSTDRSKPLDEPLRADSCYLHLHRNPTGDPERWRAPDDLQRVQRCSPEEVRKSFLVQSQHSKLLKGFGDEKKQR